MVKWIKLYKNQYLGFFALGVLLFFVQELPYMVMPLFNLTSNPIMEMPEASPFLNGLEKILGILSIAILILIVEKDAKWFSLSSKKELSFFTVAMMMLLINFGGWIFYFAGYQSKALMIVCLVAAVPLYYVFLGLWRKNYVLAITGVLFFIVHVSHVSMNLLM
ncbi:MAG: hypothetical protein LKF69_01155 [Bacilli bacterium]|nr:hypothetical protein [Bacilli bacterium]MCH4235398.1 hypothetical protein [Bacilli bacterium]